MIINPKLNPEEIKEYISSNQESADHPTQKFSYFNSALVVEEFLTPEFRQLLEGQIYSYGSDLGSIYRSTKAPNSVGGEISIPRVDQQITLIKELKGEMLKFFENVFGDGISGVDFQLRELPPNSTGHPRHLDYSKGYSTIKDQIVTPISMSLPITDHDPNYVEFIMELGNQKISQKTPGSLAIFGPKIYHHHPKTKNISTPSLWLIISLFLKTNQDQSTLLAIEKSLQNLRLEYFKADSKLFQIDINPANYQILSNFQGPSHAQRIYNALRANLHPDNPIKIYPGNYAKVSFMSAEVKYPTAIIIESL